MQANESAAPVEDFWVDSGLKVEAVYPQSGKNVQAWVRDSAGKLRVVREDEPLFGLLVEKIDPQKLVIRLSDGRSIGPSGVIPKKDVDVVSKKGAAKKSSKKKRKATA